MAVIRKSKLQKACSQLVTKSTTKVAVLMTDWGLTIRHGAIWVTNKKPNSFRNPPRFA